MSSKDIILGGGLSGLIWGVYHPGSIIIEGNKLGGMASDQWGPMIFHVPKTRDEEITWENFFDEIGMERPKAKKFRVGYMEWDSETVMPEASEDFKVRYQQHTRGDVPENIASAMNGSKNSFYGYDVSVDEVIHRCLSHIYENDGMIIQDRVVRIGSNNIFAGMRITFDQSKLYFKTTDKRLISTIPRKNLNALMGKHVNQEDWYNKSSSKGYIHLNGHNVDGFDLTAALAYDFIYVVPPKGEYVHEDAYCPSRITPRGDDLILEVTFKGNFQAAKIKDALFTKTISNTVDIMDINMHGGVVRKNDPKRYIDDIMMLGRTAVWDHSIKVGDVIAEAERDTLTR